MRHIPFETVRGWIERLAGLPAPVKMEDIPGLAAEFGWEPTNFESRYRYEEGGSLGLFWSREMVKVELFSK